MFGPFSLWSPTFRFPLSGDVSQDIEPEFTRIAGVAEIEQKVVTEVASYGKQLGKVLEALQVLAQEAEVELPEIDALIEEITAVKTESKEAARAHAEAALARLKEVDAEGWREVVGGT